jgi:MoaA/NifB/PqqE/SkfB family radical SAM enzyme
LGEKAILKNIEDFDSFIEKTGEALLQAEEIYFAGGEPLVTVEHYKLLEWLIEHRATNIRLRYNTNFSVLSFREYNVLKFWKEFSSVEIMASVDAMGPLGEYIRKESSWEQFLINREKVRALPHVQFKIAPTISVFNIHHLPHLYQFCVEKDIIQPEDLYINILERPYHYNVKALSAIYKKRVEEEYHQFYTWLEEKSISPTIKGKLQECIDYMKAEDKSKQWNKFLSETKRLDEMRGEKLENVLSFD